MNAAIPVRLGPAELSLIEQLQAVGASAAAERLAAIGLPTRKVEAYHYTDLKQLWRAVPPLAAPAAEPGTPPVDIADSFRLTFVNGGFYLPEVLPDGISAHAVAGSPLSERDDVLVRINKSLVRETLALQFGPEAKGVVHVDRRSEGQAGHAAGGLRVFVADGANVTIVETYATSAAAHATNHATLLQVGQGANVTHVTIDLSDAQASHFAIHEYHLGADATLRSLAVHAGSGLARTNILARMEGAGADGEFTGLNLLADGQHSDMSLEVVHAVPGTGSKPLYKQIGRGRSRAVFQGKIVVDRDAQKTDAKMSMQGLMLSDQAEILSKPELEIYADDVVCGHGSTCGALDETALFYLMSRGIPKRDAETMLVRAFLAAVIHPIEPEAVRDVLTSVVEGWLAG